MMTKRSRAVAALVVVAVMQTLTYGAVSEPVSINTSLRENRHWETLRTNDVNIAWRWLTSAASAQLTITGMNGTVLQTSVDTSVSNVLWHVFPSSAPSKENVYELALVFFAANNDVVGAQTSHVAVVSGAFGAVSVDADPLSKTWGVVKENVVIPYDAGWLDASEGATTSQLVIENEGVTPKAYFLENNGGYWGWRLRGVGTFDLTLSFAAVAETWTAQLFRFYPGTVLTVR